MSNYRRLISYIYAYEGGVKGKNIGFAKIEIRNGQCRIHVNVKRIFLGNNDIGVYLLSPQKEILLGRIFIRNGAGEFRINVNAGDVENSGCGMEQCYGLTIHDMENSWRSYTTIWEDAVTQAAEVQLANVTAERAGVQPGERAGGSVSEEIQRELEQEAAQSDRTLPWKAENTHIQEQNGFEEKEYREMTSARSEKNDTNQEIQQGPSKSDDRNEEESIEGLQTNEDKVGDKWKNIPENSGKVVEKTRNQENIDDDMGILGGLWEEHENPAYQQETEQIEHFSEPKKDNEETNEQPDQENDKKQSEFHGQVKDEKHGGTDTLSESGLIQTKDQEDDGWMRGTFAGPSEGVGILSEEKQTGLTGNRVQEKVMRFAKVFLQGRVPAEGGFGAASISQAGSPTGVSSFLQKNEGSVHTFPEGGTIPTFPASVKNAPVSTLPEPGDPARLAELDRQERPEASRGSIWNQLQRRYAKVLAFEYENGCEILSIKPQDIGILPRENWVYGNNSFLLHGYYNYRHLILARLENPNGQPRYLLGVPGHYFSNEKNMASMFGFPHFVLAKKQPEQDGRFGYWYTDLRL